MATLDQYRQIIEKVLTDYAAIPYSYGDVQSEVVFDRSHDRYLVMNVGWDMRHRVHGSIVHIDIIDGKIWIQRDGSEDGIATDLMDAGIPKSAIVLGFREPELRPHTGFATA